MMREQVTAEEMAQYKIDLLNGVHPLKAPRHRQEWTAQEREKIMTCGWEKLSYHEKILLACEMGRSPRSIRAYHNEIANNKVPV